MRFEGTADYVATEDLMIAVNAAPASAARNMLSMVSMKSINGS